MTESRLTTRREPKQPEPPIKDLEPERSESEAVKGGDALPYAHKHLAGVKYEN